MTSLFKVATHVIPGQHIREYPNGTKRRQEDILHLSIKQYIPLTLPSPIPKNAITIIGVHGNGFPKETYEPLWDDLHSYLRSKELYIRSIWVADCSNQGASGVLNENIQGDDTSWFDHSRDLLHMVNHFRNGMPRPIIGFAHSMGCAQLVHLSIMHPRLLSSVILCEPVMMDINSMACNPRPAFMSTIRRDLWDSRAKAEASLQKAFKGWDPRVMELYLKYGLRAVPTALYDTTKDKSILPEAVTLTTSKHQEAWGFAKPNFEPESAGLDRLLLPDWDHTEEVPLLYVCPECNIAMRDLPYLRPSVLYIFGDKSPLSPPSSQDAKMKTTGSGQGGSGGAAKGMVQKVTFSEAGHLLVFENVEEIARVSGDWVQKWFQQYLLDEEFYKGYQSKKSDKEMLRMTKAWVEMAKMPINSPRPISGKGKL